MKHNIEYHQIASLQIDKAIELYSDATIQGYICAVTLAGAAEEILGKLCEDNGVQPVLNEVLYDLGQEFTDYSKQEIHDGILNLPRNSFKHLKLDICEIDVDPRMEALLLIQRATINYCKLTRQKTDAMHRFFERVKNVA